MAFFSLTECGKNSRVEKCFSHPSTTTIIGQPAEASTVNDDNPNQKMAAVAGLLTTSSFKLRGLAHKCARTLLCLACVARHVGRMVGNGLTDGRAGGRAGRRTDGWTDGRTDGQAGGRADERAGGRAGGRSVA